jgi:hypothetical protein
MMLRSTLVARLSLVAQQARGLGRSNSFLQLLDFQLDFFSLFHVYHLPPFSPFELGQKTTSVGTCLSPAQENCCTRSYNQTGGQNGNHGL